MDEDREHGFRQMKHLLLTTIAAVVLVGCGESQQSATAPEAKPESATVKVPDISIHEAAEDGNIEDLTVIMRVNPTSSDVVGHTRTETGVGDISNLSIPSIFASLGASFFET